MARRQRSRSAIRENAIAVTVGTPIWTVNDAIGGEPRLPSLASALFSEKQLTTWAPTPSTATLAVAPSKNAPGPPSTAHQSPYTPDGPAPALAVTYWVPAVDAAWPSMSASGLWQSTGWVRGTWPLGFSGDLPSGLCAMYASLAGQSLPGSSSSQSPWEWHQCDAPPASDSVVTDGYGQGAQTLALSAADAAVNTVGYSKTVYLDNQQPTISLSGPTVSLTARTISSTKISPGPLDHWHVLSPHTSKNPK